VLVDSWLHRKYRSRSVSVNTYNLIKIREESNMGSNLGLIAFGLIALFATSMIKIAAIAALGWGVYKAYRDWGAM